MEVKEKKYEILKEQPLEFNGLTLYRIRATRDFGEVKAGDLGGFVEEEGNLSQDGDCWLFDDAKAFHCGRVYGSLKFRGNTEISCVGLSESADIKENIKVWVQSSNFCVSMSDKAVCVPMFCGWSWNTPEYYGLLLLALLGKLKTIRAEKEREESAEGIISFA